MSRVHVVFSTKLAWYTRLFRWFLWFFRGDVFANYMHIMYESSLFGGWWVVIADKRGLKKIPVHVFERKFKIFECYEYMYNLDQGLQHERVVQGNDYVAWVLRDSSAVGFDSPQVLSRSVEDIYDTLTTNPAYRRACQC